MGKPGRDRASSPVNLGDFATRQEVWLHGPPPRSGGEHMTRPDQVARRGQTAGSTGSPKL